MKEFKMPEIYVSVFNEENICTLSAGDVTKADETAIAELKNSGKAAEVSYKVIF